MTGRRAGALVVVATPIGNLGDLSPRAVEALRAAALILCEDTRHSRPLLDRAGANGRAISCHAHNETERVDEVLAALERGERVALVTDAGAPAVSDPGGRIVEAVAARALTVEVVPGPSALVAALMGAGLDTARFSFLGFLPRRGRARRALFADVVRAGFAAVLYESPARVADTLADLHQAFGARRVVVARELTKLHETFHRGVLGGPLSPPFVEKGEVVIVVEAAEAQAAVEEVDVAAVARDATLSPKERARRIAAASGMTVREAYALVTNRDEGAR
ncbi:MAG: 16S rRNA (cytidine(1402)-2'-O)-methyltransferase [Deltaproteobacteria bacterium]|nr:16S rRNA (cytidine(1402)-2'-O)-methyltransferase [Deltaproteobacteria bacterium]